MIKASILISELGLEKLYLNYTITRERPIGQGSYGSVYSAVDSKGDKVAIKIIDKRSNDTYDNKLLLREIRALYMMKGHDCIVNLKHAIMSSPQSSTSAGIALVFDALETDLSRIIYSPQPLSLLHIKYLLYQIILGTHYLHSAKLVHRDLKPGNILINGNCSIAICDFGLARATHTAVAESAQGTSTQLYRRLTSYVITRWYRSIEVALEHPAGGEAPADMWSIGCILAELLLRKPLFKQSYNKEEEHKSSNKRLVESIVKILGTPKPEDCGWINPENLRQKILQIPGEQPELDSLLSGHDASAVDLLKKLLHIDPRKRLTAENALKHPFLIEYSDKLSPSEFSFHAMSPAEKAALQGYYKLEQDSIDCANDSRLDKRVHALIDDELSLLAPIASPSTVPGTIFHFSQDSDNISQTIGHSGTVATNPN